MKIPLCEGFTLVLNEEAGIVHLAVGIRVTGRPPLPEHMLFLREEFQNRLRFCSGRASNMFTLNGCCICVSFT